MKLEIDLPPDITYQFPTLMDVIRHAIKSSGIPLKVLADKTGERDENALSRKLSANDRDNVNFPLKKLSALIDALGEDGRIIVEWQVAKHLVSQDQKLERATHIVLQAMPMLARAFEDFGYEVRKVDKTERT